jgi:GNAT superfamily N-acetyltransferase
MNTRQALTTEEDIDHIATLLNISNNGAYESYYQGLGFEDWKAVSKKVIAHPDCEYHPNNTTFILKDDQVAGLFVSLKIDPKYKKDLKKLPEIDRPFAKLFNLCIGSYRLRDVALYPDYVGQGLGHVIMQSFLKEADDKGVLRRTLNVHELNTPMTQLTLKYGFKEFAKAKIKEHPNYKVGTYLKAYYRDG